MNQKLSWMTEGQRYGFAALSVIPVRASANDSSEQVTQLLFGEPIEILSYQFPWLAIRSLQDGYEGYVDHKQILPLTEKEWRRWHDEGEFLCNAMIQINGPMGIQTISAGSMISPSKDFNIGPYNYQHINRLETLNAWDFALQFLNTPYLWGGRSIFGIDCSGFTQSVYRQIGTNLPRDAYQQAECGQIIAFEERQLMDLAFFINGEGRIHHVGLIGAKDQLLHASGQVRIDLLLEEGIYNEAANKITHSLYQIKRLF
jgi:hypothetical protein